MKNNTLISIITPCYNGSAYIDRCAKSVLCQTYIDFEWVIINDGSSDDSETILRKLAEIDSRIKVISVPNGGVSKARNLGLQEATGTWITFLDIDDTLKTDALSTLLNITLFDKRIMFVMAGYHIIKQDIIQLKIKNKELYVSSIEIAKELFKPSDYPYQGYICSKLYNKKIIDSQKLTFNENIFYNEDRLFTFEYLSFCDWCAYTTKPVYNYIQNGLGAMSSIEGSYFWKFETDLDAFLEMFKISARFKSNIIEYYVKIGAYISFLRNQKLNKKYGDKNIITQKRLKKKIVDIIPPKDLWKYWLRYNVKRIFSRVNFLIKKLNFYRNFI